MTRAVQREELVAFAIYLEAGNWGPDAPPPPGLHTGEKWFAMGAQEQSYWLALGKVATETADHPELDPVPVAAA